MITVDVCNKQSAKLNETNEASTIDRRMIQVPIRTEFLRRRIDEELVKRLLVHTIKPQTIIQWLVGRKTVVGTGKK